MRHKIKQRGFEPVDNNFKKFPDVDYMKPKRADKRSAGYDMYSPVDVIIHPNKQLLIWTDVKAYMLDDEILEANTRSGNGVKANVVLANTIGWIDSSYYSNKDNDGNIGLALKNDGNHPFEIKKGDRIAQVKFGKYLVADDDEFIHNERKGGFGSSNE